MVWKNDKFLGTSWEPMRMEGSQHAIFFHQSQRATCLKITRAWSWITWRFWWLDHSWNSANVMSFVAIEQCNHNRLLTSALVVLCRRKSPWKCLQISSIHDFFVPSTPSSIDPLTQLIFEAVRSCIEQGTILHTELRCRNSYDLRSDSWLEDNIEGFKGHPISARSDRWI